MTIGAPYEGPLRFVELFGGPQDGQKQQIPPTVTRISFPTVAKVGVELGDVHHWYQRSASNPEVFNYAGEGPV